MSVAKCARCAGCDAPSNVRWYRRVDQGGGFGLGQRRADDAVRAAGLGIGQSQVAQHPSRPRQIIAGHEVDDPARRGALTVSVSRHRDSGAVHQGNSVHDSGRVYANQYGPQLVHEPKHQEPK